MNRIKELRKAKGLSQTQLAELLFEKQTTISNWEKGVSEPDISSLIKLSKELDTTIDYLVCNNTDDLIIINRKEFDDLRKARDAINKADLAYAAEQREKLKKNGQK
ncbi:MAG: helix-turn-helix transcriptional regulator [Bacilli bacterium]|jgi:transcriptional regulator with XRE-family HTH domain